MVCGNKPNLFAFCLCIAHLPRRTIIGFITIGNTHDKVSRVKLFVVFFKDFLCPNMIGQFSCVGYLKILRAIDSCAAENGFQPLFNVLNISLFPFVEKRACNVDIHFICSFLSWCNYIIQY